MSTYNRNTYETHLEDLENIQTFLGRYYPNSLQVRIELTKKRLSLWQFLLREGAPLLAQDPQIYHNTQRMLEEVLRRGVDAEVDEEEYGDSTTEHFVAKRLHDFLLSHAKPTPLKQLLKSLDAAKYEFDHTILRIQLWTYLLSSSTPSSLAALQPKDLQTIKMLLHITLSQRQTHFPAHRKEEFFLAQQVAKRLT